MYQDALAEKGKEFFPFLKNFNDFYLAGGTALALQIGHRISIDFDFFSEKDIPKDLLLRIENIFKGKNVSAIINNSEELTVIVDEVKITFVKYPFLPVLDLIGYRDIKLLSIGDIAASKAYSIGRRGVLKDYIDLYFIISKGLASLEEIISLAEKKFKDVFNSRLFLEQLIFLDDIEDVEVVFLKEKIDKEKIRIFFEEKIKKIKI